MRSSTLDIRASTKFTCTLLACRQAGSLCDGGRHSSWCCDIGGRDGATHPCACAGLASSRHKHALVVILGVNDLHVHHAGAQAQVLQVIPNNCKKILVIIAVPIAVEVGGVLSTLAIRQVVLPEFIWHSVRPCRQLYNLAAACVGGQHLRGNAGKKNQDGPWKGTYPVDGHAWGRAAAFPVLAHFIPAEYCAAPLFEMFPLCAGCAGPAAWQQARRLLSMLPGTGVLSAPLLRDTHWRPAASRRSKCCIYFSRYRTAPAEMPPSRSGRRRSRWAAVPCHCAACGCNAASGSRPYTCDIHAIAGMGAGDR
jgi:hypothetical protein